ncbi:hypothetical protein [Empedobacter tilapiae]|nr:hypothetical protein [Empedobacter tilapiae]
MSSINEILPLKIPPKCKITISIAAMNRVKVSWLIMVSIGE